MIPSRIDPEVRELILYILQRDTERRPTIEQIMEHKAVRRYVNLFVQPMTREDLKLLARNYRINTAGEVGRYCPKFVKEMTGFNQQSRQLTIGLDDKSVPENVIRRQPEMNLPPIIHRVYKTEPQISTISPRLVSVSLSPNRVSLAQRNGQFGVFKGEPMTVTTTIKTQPIFVSPKTQKNDTIQSQSISHFGNQKQVIYRTQQSNLLVEKKLVGHGNDGWYDEHSVSSKSGQFINPSKDIHTPVKRAVNFLNSAKTDTEQSSKQLQNGESSISSQNGLFVFSRKTVLNPETPVRRSLFISSNMPIDPTPRSQERIVRTSNQPFPHTLSRQVNTLSVNDLTAPKTFFPKSQNTKFVNAIPPFYLLGNELNMK